jgi:AAA family ATP:ADP antiporter
MPRAHEPTITAPGALERALSVVTEVRAGEGATALILTLDVFLLLTAYYVIKPVREALILAMESGAEYKSYMGGAIAIALLFAVPAYARAASRVAKNRLVVGVTLFFASHLLLFYAAAHIEAARAVLGLVFFLWVGIFNMMVVAQFWALANDLYTEEQGKRLFALVGLGASAGAAAGSSIASWLIEPLGLFQMLLLSAALLVACAALSQSAYAREAARRPTRAADSATRAPTGAFAMVWQHRYLTLLAGFSLVFTFENANGEYVLGRLAKEEALAAVAAGRIAKDQVGGYIGAFYGELFTYVNVLGMLVQALVVSRLVRRFGLGVAFFVLPVIALLDAGATAALPVLAVARVGKIAENATDYSINNSVRNMLWLPTTEEMKYKAKQAIDTFFVRMGDVSSALLVYVGAGLLGWGVRAFAIVNLLLVGVWLVVARAILSERERLGAAEPRKELSDAAVD